MVAAHDPALVEKKAMPLTNKVVKVLSSQGSKYKTFGANIILLLNREGKSQSCLCYDVSVDCSRRDILAATDPQIDVPALYHHSYLRVFLHQRSPASSGHSGPQSA